MEKNNPPMRLDELALGVAKALDLGIRKFTLSIDTSIAVERIILNGR